MLDGWLAIVVIGMDNPPPPPLIVGRNPRLPPQIKSETAADSEDGRASYLCTSPRVQSVVFNEVSLIWLHLN